MAETLQRSQLTDVDRRVLFIAAAILDGDYGGRPEHHPDWSDDLPTKVREIALSGETFETWRERRRTLSVQRSNDLQDKPQPGV